MSRTLAGFTFLLIAIVVPRASLRAEEPARQGGVIVGQSTLTLTGSVGNTDAGVLTVTPLAGAISGSTTVSFGTLQVGNGNWSSGTLLGSWGVDTSFFPDSRRYQRWWRPLDSADTDSRRPGLLHHYGRSGLGRQRAERALYRQGDGTGRSRPRSTASPSSPARRFGSPGRRPPATTRALSSPSIGRPFQNAGSTRPITSSCPAIAWSSARTR